MLPRNHLHCLLLHTEELLNMELHPKLRQLRIHEAGVCQQSMRAVRLQLPGVFGGEYLQHLHGWVLREQWAVHAV